MLDLFFRTRSEANEALSQRGNILFESIEHLEYIAVRKSLNPFFRFKLELGSNQVIKGNRDKKALIALGIPEAIDFTSKESTPLRIKVKAVYSNKIDVIKAKENNSQEEIPKIIKAGDSLSNRVINSGGTIGAFLTLKNQKGIYGITNAHVIKGKKGRIGDDIYAPRLAGSSGTYEQHALGELCWGDHCEQFDAALFKVNFPTRVGKGMKCSPNKILKGIGQAQENRRVKKCGFSSGLKANKIRSENCSFRNHNTGLIYTHQLQIKHISEPGDSGSLVYNKDNLAVGLLFAADTSEKEGHSYATPMSRIFNTHFPVAMDFGNPPQQITKLEINQFI